jgi:transposase
MRTVREILRLRLGVGLSADKVAKSCKISKATVLEYEKRFSESSLSWPVPDDMDDSALSQIVRRPREKGKPRRDLPDMTYLIKEMRRPHVTLYLLWMEYREATPDGYSYTQFCYYYGEAKKRLDVTLRQFHKAGEKVFTDYAGDTATIIDPKNGLKTPVYLFVATLGASSYTFAEGVLSMNLPSWIDSHIRAFEFFGGVPQIVVPDNTKCAVIHPDRYEPDLNPSFAEMAAHYGTAIIPARVRKPRDKAKVEAAVLLAERWILAALRNRTFFSLTELNEAIGELLDKLNSRKFKQIDATREDLFAKLDAPALAPLPMSRYQFAEWAKAKVNIDYHIAACKHFYSVPYQLVGENVEIKMTATFVEILYKNRRVASHIRSYVEGGFTTNPDHRPKSHQKYLEWTPSRIISWASSKGPSIAALVARILETKPHPEMGYRSCLGIIRLADLFTAERVEAASERALRCNAISYTSVKSILKKGLDKLPIKETPEYVPVSHANIRGKEYYTN